MRYNHLDMLPEKAFSPVGKRMTLEGGGGLGKVAGVAGNIATGGSPLGAFGSALGTEIAGNMLGGGGGSSGGPYAPGQPGSSNPYGMGNMYRNPQFQGFGGGNNNFGFGMPYQGGMQNQTQIIGPYAGMNPASIAYRGGMPTQGGAFQQYQNMPGMRRDDDDRQSGMPQVGAQPTITTPALPANPVNPAADYGMAQKFAHPYLVDLAKRAGGAQNLFNSTPVRPREGGIAGLAPQIYGIK